MSKSGITIPRILAYLSLVAGALIFAYPFVWMALATLKPEVELSSINVVPREWSTESYELVFRNIPIERSFLNSVIVAIVVTGSALIFGSMASYSLAKLQWRGRDAVFGLILFTMMVPFLVLLIPLYTLVVQFGWTDSLAGLAIPFMMNATVVLILRQSFLSIPQDLLDAARIDGSGEFRILFTIVWPLSVPALVTAGIIVFIGNWNEVLWPLIVVREESWMTMPQMVTLFATGGGAEGKLGPRLAAALLLAIPVIVAYMLFQKRFIASLASTGLKG
jgi:multiple sugar transport system permease protein